MQGEQESISRWKCNSYNMNPKDTIFMSVFRLLFMAPTGQSQCMCRENKMRLGMWEHPRKAERQGSSQAALSCRAPSATSPVWKPD